MTNKIPKIIHYCWFGNNQLTDEAKKCIASWKKYCPDYEIIEWNEKNFDINCCDYVNEAYEAKKWAFVSDVVRLYALAKYGGIYMDTDVEMVKNPDYLLDNEAVSGFETRSQIQTAFLAAIPQHKAILELLDEYKGLHFLRRDSSYDLKTNVTRMTKKFVEDGLVLNNNYQTVKGITFLPMEYLSPKDYDTQEIVMTTNTVVIHHFDGSWHEEDEVLFEKIMKKHYIFSSNKLFRYICKFYCIMKCHGLKRAVRFFYGWLIRKKTT